MKSVVRRIVWCVHTGLFLWAVMRFRIPIFILPWLILYLIHSYRVWFKPDLGPAETELDKFKENVAQLKLSEGEGQKIIDLAVELKTRISAYEQRDIPKAISEVELQITDTDDDGLRNVLQQKKELLLELKTAHEGAQLDFRMLKERVNVLNLQALQENQAIVEYQDIEDKLKERQAVHHIMKQLDSWE